MMIYYIGQFLLALGCAVAACGGVALMVNPWLPQRWRAACARVVFLGVATGRARRVVRVARPAQQTRDVIVQALLGDLVYRAWWCICGMLPYILLCCGFVLIAARPALTGRVTAGPDRSSWTAFAGIAFTVVLFLVASGLSGRVRALLIPDRAVVVKTHLLIARSQQPVHGVGRERIEPVRHGLEMFRSAVLLSLSPPRSGSAGRRVLDPLARKRAWVNDQVDGLIIDLLDGKEIRASLAALTHTCIDGLCLPRYHLIPEAEVDAGSVPAGSTSSRIWASVVVVLFLAVSGCAAYFLPKEAPYVIGGAVAAIGAISTIWRIRSLESLREELAPALGR